MTERTIEDQRIASKEVIIALGNANGASPRRLFEALGSGVVTIDLIGGNSYPHRRLSRAPRLDSLRFQAPPRRIKTG